MINCIENKLCGFRYKIQIVVIIVYIFIDKNKKVMTIANEFLNDVFIAYKV